MRNKRRFSIQSIVVVFTVFLFVSLFASLSQAQAKYAKGTTHVKISNLDIQTGKNISGAKFQVFNNQNQLVKHWTSNGKPHVFDCLPVGKYTLKQVVAPRGYALANTVKFKVTSSTAMQSIVVKNDYTKLSISNKDITDDRDIPYSVLQIVDANGKVIKQWMTKNKPYQIDRLLVGNYTLREVEAHSGYVIPNAVKFTVKPTGVVQSVSLKSDYTKVLISIKDRKTGKDLKGVTLQVFDAYGHFIQEWVTDGKPHQINRLVAANYIVKEVNVPMDYASSSDVSFIVANKAAPKSVIMYNEPK